MSRLVERQQDAMHKHPVFWPAIAIIVGGIILVLGLVFFLYRSFYPERDPQDMNHPVQQFEDKQEQQYQNSF